MKLSSCIAALLLVVSGANYAGPNIPGQYLPENYTGSAPSLTCIPQGLGLEGATGSLLRSGQTDAGTWYGTWCMANRHKVADLPWVYTVAREVQISNAITPQLALGMALVLASKGQSDILLATINNIRVPPKDDKQRDELRELRKVANAAMRIGKPNHPVWVVVADPQGKALPGAPCKCHEQAVEVGPLSWCGWYGDYTESVALCRPTPKEPK